MPTPMITEYLCNKQPHSIRSRLLENKDFMLKYDLKPSSVITIAGKIHLNQHVLMRAIRNLFEKKELTHVLDVAGNKHSLNFDQGHISFESASKEVKAELDNFFILSPDREERLNKLNEIFTAIGPMSSNYSKLLSDARNVELSYEQIDELLYDLHTGVAALQDRTRRAFGEQQATLDNLVPTDLTYYEYFCGPDPAGDSTMEYLFSTLPNYRKRLLNRDFVKGLDVCLQGALKDELMPGVWISGYSDDEVWNGMQACDPLRDPIVLLGALDIAVLRQADARFKAFAEDAVETLLKDDFLREDHIDVYEFLPSLAGLVLNHINVLEKGTSKPPYWKRMCAWMQAGFIMRQTQRLKLDYEGVKGWISSNITQAGNFVNLLDLRMEPMYQALYMSKSSFRAEILGRLHIACLRHNENGTSMPKSDKIDCAISMLEENGSPLGWALPGPLDGYSRPAERGTKISEDMAKELSEGLVSDKAEKFLSVFTYLSQIYDLGENLLERIRDIIINSNFGNKFDGFPHFLRCIIDSGFIACAHQDSKLSRAIGEKIVSASPWVNSEFTVENVIGALLITGAGIREENDCIEWLESQFTEVAYRLPAGKNMKKFLDYIRELKKVANLKTGVLAKAEAIASAAI